MNVINTQFLKNLFIQPILKSTLQARIKPGDVLKGKIIQALPRQNTFILHTRGMNLVAGTNLSLFVGDRISGKVLSTKKQIELKLIKVNNKSVHQNVKLSDEGINYSRVPLTENIFGKDAFLEIYPDHDAKSNKNKFREAATYHFILTSQELKNIILDLKLIDHHLYAGVWIEKKELYEFLEKCSSAIEDSLIDDEIFNVTLKIKPLLVDAGTFRKQWTAELNLDIRA